MTSSIENAEKYLAPIASSARRNSFCCSGCFPFGALTSIPTNYPLTTLTTQTMSGPLSAPNRKSAGSSRGSSRCCFDSEGCPGSLR
jgi:hypothetical protein